MSVKRNITNLVYGMTNASQGLNPEPIFAQRAPTSSDVCPLGTVWFYKISSISSEIFILVSSGNWTQLTTGSGGGSPTFDDLTVTGTTLLEGQLTVNSGTAAIALGTDAFAKTITLGNSTGTTSITLNAGTGGINIGTNAIAHTITLGNSTGATSLVLNGGTSGLNIGTNAIAHTITMGNTTGATSLVFNTGSGGVNIPSFTTTGALVSNASGLITDATASTAGFILTSNGSGSAPSFQAAPSSGMAWSNVTTPTQAMAVSNGYVSNDGATLVTFTLPATASVGQIVAVQGAGSGLWTIAQNSGQTIHSNGGSSTTGVGGSVSSSGQYDVVYLMCTTVNTDWSINSSVGNLNFV